jgi:hypothetical protein
VRAMTANCYTSDLPRLHRTPGLRVALTGMRRQAGAGLIAPAIAGHATASGLSQYGGSSISW